MHADELRKLLRATPFQPFTVYLPSDKAFQVPHKDFAWLTPMRDACRAQGEGRF